MGHLLYFEGNSGASGDMILSCLLDLGFPEEKLQQTLDLLGQNNMGTRSQVKEVTRSGMRAKLVEPGLPDEKKSWKLDDFLSVIVKSKLSENIKEKTASLLRRLAKVEGRIHGKNPEELHFHELGGWDTLFDLVGAIAGFEYFEIHEVDVGPLNVGGGTVSTSHGILPVPVPAVVELMKGFTLYSSGIETELLTPTGALILSSFGKPVRSFPRMTLERTGIGAGQKELPIPNVLRAFLGKPIETLTEDCILKLETNIDDMNPQFWEHTFEQLYEKGAHEVFLTPVLMKKSRPAYVLTVLAPLDKEEALSEVIFLETTTLGIRKETVPRTVLERKIEPVETPYGKIPCKLGTRNGRIFNISPELDVMKAIAKDQKVPLKKLYQAVLQSMPSDLRN